MGRVGYGPSLSWAEFVMGRDVQLPIGTAVADVLSFLQRVVHTFLFAGKTVSVLNNSESESLNLNNLLVKRQIDNPSSGAVTGGN